MTTGEYRDRLFAELQGFDPDEVGSVVDYYTELIEDADDPQQQMLRLGTPEQLAYKIKQENGWIAPEGFGQGGYQQYGYQNAAYPPPQKGGTAGRVIALILTFPFWVTGYALIISLFAVAAAFGIIFPSAVAAAIISMLHFVGISVPYAAEMLFVAIFCAGMTVLLIRPIRAMFRGIAGLLKEFSLFLFAPGAVRGVPKYQPKPISKAAVALGVMMAVIGLTGTCALEVHNRKNIDSYVKEMGLETVEKEIPAGLSDLNIEMGTGNIELLPADDGKSRIVCENVVKDKLTISDGGSMKVKYSYSTTSRIASFKFGFEESFAQKTTAKIKVYLTEDRMTSIKLDNDLGEIKCSGINADKLSISCDCGDAEIENCTINTLDVHNSLGETDLEGCEISGALTLAADCGSVEMADVKCLDTVDITEKLGSVTVRDSELAKLTVVNDCGDVSLKSVKITVSGDLTLELGSADLKLIGSDYDINATCDLGDAEINDEDASKAPRGSIPVSVHCDTGDIDVTTY